jgi:hypothetical protein
VTGSAEGLAQRFVDGQARGLAAFARELRLERRARSRFLPGELFGEPAWDLLLDCYAGDPEEGALLHRSQRLERLDEGEFDETSAVARALLSLGILARAGGDGGQARLELTPEAHEAMGKALSAILLRRAAAAPATWGEAFAGGEAPGGASDRDARLTLVAAKLLDCLDELDRLDLFEPGAHLSLALDALGRAPDG